ncbi:MAG: amino acid adenylation domain-containing protein [Caldilineaceae bacterium]
MIQAETVAGFRLSPQQCHLWQLRESAPAKATDPFYCQCTIQLTGPLDRARLADALQQVVDRYEILRTSFHSLPGMSLPVQVITKVPVAQLNFYDLCQLDDAAQTAQVAALWQAGLDAPWVFTDAPLQSTLVKLAHEQHLLILRLSALCGDHTTLVRLTTEIAAGYGAAGEPLAANEETGEEDEPLQYADLAEWLNGLQEDEEAAGALSYWRSQPLTNLLAMHLPAERTPPASTTFTVQQLRVALDPAVVTWSQQQDILLADLLLTGWQVLLYRLTGQGEQILGITMDGRADAELATALGLLSQSIPLCTQLVETLPFQTVLDQSCEQVSASRDLQEYFSWEMVREWLESDGEPYLPYSFGFTETPAPIAADGVTFALVNAHSDGDRYKLHLHCTQDASGVTATFHYDAALFSEAAISRMAEEYQTLLADALTRPDAPIGALTVVGPTERQQVLVAFNATQHTFPTVATFQACFEEQVARTPEAAAIVDFGFTIYDLRLDHREQIVNRKSEIVNGLTYRDLNARANQLAHWLQSRGVGPDMLVGLCLERSAEMVVALLAVLKAGGAYVPLDPAYPQARLAFMVADAQVKVVLTQESLRERLPATKGDVFCLDRDWERVAHLPTTNPASETAGHHLAYVIYTSGSTGQPKGVMVEQRNLLNYLHWAVDAYRVAEGNGTLVHSPLGFDLTITSLLAPLLVGQQVLLLPEADALDALQAALQAAQELTLLKITPAHLDALSHLLTPAAAARRTQAFIIGGEALVGEQIAFWQRHAPQTRLINEYGPTETVVGCCVYEAAAAEAFPGPVPIGTPIANTQLYVLDAHGNPVPIGVPGELYIGGAGVARGYLNRPDLTNKRFVPDPFAADLQARLYRTGDLVRQRETGNGLVLEFLGRLDQQVKVRGYRIELGEIESVLLRHPQVREAAVTAQADEMGNKRLVAYVAPVAGAAVDVPLLTHYLHSQLPAYMVPAHFISLAALPLTANGKVDRQALPAPERVQVTEYVAPRSPTEATLAAIWAELLGLERVGVHDNFFALGGDSIQSIQVVARANQQGLHLTMQQMFQYQSIAALAKQVSEDSPLVAEQGEVTGPAPLTPIQHWFFAQEHPVPTHYNQSLVLSVAPTLEPVLLEGALQALVRHHDALRLTFRQIDDEWQQAHSPVRERRLLTVLDLSALPAAEQTAVQATAVAHCHGSFDFTAGALLRALLVRTSPHTLGELHLVIHHLAVDGVSWRILLADLQQVYQQLTDQQPNALPAKSSSFQAWAERLHGHANSPEMTAELATWSEQPWDAVLPLPVDYTADEAANTLATTATHTATLGATLTHALLHEAQQVYNTQINDLLLAALLRTFSQWTDESVLLVDLEGHGREPLFPDLDLSRTVGWFTTLFPVLLSLAPTAADDTGALIKSVKEQLRHIPQHGIGYGLLRYLNPATGAALAALPKAEVLFNYLGQFDDLALAPAHYQPALAVAKQHRNGHGNGNGQQNGVHHRPPTFLPLVVQQDQNAMDRLDQSRLGTRTHLIEINGLVVNGSLQMTWSFSSQIYAERTIARLAGQFNAALQEIIRHCQTAEAGGFTPSDFPEARLDQGDLDTLLAKIGQVG